MKYLITDIDLDFEDSTDSGLSQDEQSEILNDLIGHIWEADDEDDLIEEVTSASGYCIKSINYNHILK